MPRGLHFVVVTALLALRVPSGALAAVNTIVLQSSPIAIGPFGVARGVQRVDSPALDGSVVAMSADVRFYAEGEETCRSRASDPDDPDRHRAVAGARD